MSSYSIYGVDETFTLAASASEIISLDISILHRNLKLFFTVTGPSGVDLNIASGTGDPDIAAENRGGFDTVIGTPPSTWHFDTQGANYSLPASETTAIVITQDDTGNKLKLTFSNAGVSAVTIKIRGDY